MGRLSTLGHKLVCGLLAGVMAFAVPGAALAQEGADVPEWAIDDGGDVGDGLQAQAGLPTAYDLRNEGVVTPVKRQNPWSSCWAFGAIAAAETSLLSSTGSTYANEPLDLSESHLANFALTPIVEADDPTQVGEGLHLTHSASGSNTAINSGGDPFHATTLFASGGGPAPEMLFPYRGSTATTDLDNYINNKDEVVNGEVREHFDFFMGMTLEQYLTENPGVTEEQALEEAYDKALKITESDNQYVDTDDWSIPATNENGVSNRFGTVGYVLQNGNILPEYWNTVGESQTLNPAGQTAIKEEILNGRGVAICMLADQSRPDQSGNRTYLNQETWSQYSWVRSMNHAVCIVGWDDNYSRDNFTHKLYERDDKGGLILEDGQPIEIEGSEELTTPEHDGAWLAKNSWGSETDASPDDLGNVVNRGKWGITNEAGEHTGYFWISYDDKSLTKAESYEFSLDLNWLNDYDCLQYDYMPVQINFFRLHDNGSTDVVSTANVFNIEGDREVKAVSAFAPTENTRTTVALYRLNAGATNPTDGEMLYRTSKNFTYRGYHRLDIDVPITLRSGERLAVVSTASYVDDNGARLYDASWACGVSKSHIDGLNETQIAQGKELYPFYSEGVVNEGESFLYDGGTWRDWSEVKAEMESQDPTYVFDNFGLKVYTVAAEVQDVTVAYRSHVESLGWEQQWYHNGDQSGTTGQSKRIEAVEMKLENAPFEGSIEYRGHVEGQGWEQSWAADGATSGTSGQSKRVEALQVRLTGDIADRYSVWYRVHSQNMGWLGWATDGQAAGTAGQALRAESLQVQVLPKGEVPEGYVEGQASYVGAVTGSAHVQDQGWTANAASLSFGTTGMSRRVEALRLSVPNQPEAGGIAYEVHAEGNGWMGEVVDGELAGTTGESRRLEAVRALLTGDMATNYSIWYRVHSQDYGWLGWAHDGAVAGTTGLSKRAEAVDMQILPQGQVPNGYDAAQDACVGD